MKQIALVLFLTAMAAVGYVVTQKLTRPEQRQTQGPGVRVAPPTGGVQAPGSTRPSLGANPEQEVVFSEDFLAEKAKRDNFDWKAVADPSSVVNLNQAWSFDLSGVDFDAEIPFQVDGQDVHRDRLRAFALLDRAAPLVEARLLRDLAVHRAAQRGLDVELATSEKQRFFDLAAASKGMTADQFRAQLSAVSGLSPAVATELRTSALEGTLATVIGVADANSLPPAFKASMALGQSRQVIDSSLELINQGWEEFVESRAGGGPPSDESINKMASGLDAFSLFGSNAIGDELAFRLWTFLDTPDAPMDFVAGASFRDLSSVEAGPLWEVLGPPWEEAADSSQVNVGDLWDIFSVGLTRDTLERSAQDYLYFHRLRTDLQQRSLALSPQESWSNYVKEYATSRGTAFGMEFLYLQLEGYPSLHHYRAQAALQAGFERGLPAGWDSERELAAFFDRNRFFIEQWQPNLSMTIFPAVDPNDATGTPDWQGALEGAQALCDRAAAGEEFVSLVQENNRALIDGVRSMSGDEAAGELESQIGGGATGFLGITQIDELLDLKHYDQLLIGTSVARSAAAHLEPGEISEPWRTPLGYVVIRVDSARLGELEREYEDSEFETQYFYRESRYQNWVNDVLTGSKLAAN